MTEPAYPAARIVSQTVETYFARELLAAEEKGLDNLAPAPDAETIEIIIDALFWASLRREETYSPKISLAFLPPAQAKQPLRFERELPLTPASLAKLAPAVERPGIHLGVWRHEGQLCLWGTTRSIPTFCFVLEVIEPGLLVVKYRRSQEATKYTNVVVLKGDQIKVVDHEGKALLDCPDLLIPLLGFGMPPSRDNSINALVQLAVSMRAHGRGGSLLVVPQGSETWRESILPALPYAVAPAYLELAELMKRSAGEKSEPAWQEAFIDAVDAIAGLTAVDGAAVMTDQYEVLAFGAKLGRRDGGGRVQQVVLTEPTVGGAATVVHPLELGGTRHLSAAQFIQDQRDSVALVASQDGRFTIFAWSPCEQMVHAHRVETLLL